NGVVDTPRRARPSVTNRGNNRVAAREASHNCLGNGQGGIFVSFDYRKLAEAGVQEFLDLLQQEAGIGFAVVKQPNRLALQVSEASCERQIKHPRLSCRIEYFNATHENPLSLALSF